MKITAEIAENFLRKQNHLNYLKRTLQFNDMQALLFSHFIDRANDNCIFISEIANVIGAAPSNFFSTSKILKRSKGVG